MVKTDPASFRGSLSGFGFAYCNFTHRNQRAHFVRAAARPLPLAAPATTGSVSPDPVQSSAVVLRRSQD